MLSRLEIEMNFQELRAFEFDPHLDVLVSNRPFVSSYDQHGVLKKGEYCYYLNT